jgi:hypothetical protein
MIIYIQSKSGDYNTTRHIHSVRTLQEACWKLRTDGGYYHTDEGEEFFIPFEQIEYIEEKSTLDE